jgi:hypothetical protein
LKPSSLTAELYNAWNWGVASRLTALKLGIRWQQRRG